MGEKAKNNSNVLLVCYAYDNLQSADETGFPMTI